MTKATFRLADLARAVKGVRAAGLPVNGVEITAEGTIKIVSTDSPSSAQARDATTVVRERLAGVPWARSK